MSDTLKTIAEFMGWKVFLNDPDSDDHYCTEEFSRESGAVMVHYFRPHSCRDDLQLVIERFTPDQLRALAARVHDRAAGLGDRIDKVIGIGVYAGIIYALKLPATTLADIVADVIKETT